MNSGPNFALDSALALEPAIDIAASDQMFRGNNRHYFGVGRSAILSILNAFSARDQFNGGETSPHTILDFGCGHGRVARFLRAAFPIARLEVTDHNRDGVRWCIEQLACHEMGDAIRREHYDLVWVGSVLTHLPERHALSLLADLKQSLRPYGILVYTTQGRLSAANLEAFSAGNQDSQIMHYGMSREATAQIVESYNTAGFGYCDYPHQTDYGIAVGKLEWFIDRTLDERMLLLFAQERGWDTHQDVLAFMRAPSDPSGLVRGRLYAT